MILRCCRSSYSAGLVGLLTLVALPGSAELQGKDWPQWRGANRDGVWRETGLVSKFEGSELKRKWAVPISNGYSGPTVAKGKVYVTDRVKEPREVERILCFDAETGKPIWTVTYDCVYKGVSYPNGPRASVTVQDGLAYSLGSMGHLYCLNAATGKIAWMKDLNASYKIRLPDWGIAAAPIVEGGLVITMIGGEGNACLVAFDRKTGVERWKALPDRATYSAPIVIDQAGRRVLVCWTADRVVGLNPATGALYWEQAHPSQQLVDGITTPAVFGDKLFVASVYEGSFMMRLGKETPTAAKLWKRQSAGGNSTEALMSMLATPILTKDHVYGLDYYGELRCLDANTGDRLWEDTTVVPRAMWASAHLIQNGENTWIFNERGQLIIAKLSPKGYTEISRSLLIKPTRGQLNQRGGVAWSHPAFAYKHVFARNDEELVCVSLAGE